MNPIDSAIRHQQQSLNLSNQILWIWNEKMFSLDLTMTLWDQKFHYRMYVLK